MREMILKKKTPTAVLFDQRIGVHTARGLTGAAVYEALAIDDQLPATFCPDDVAGILGIERASLKRRRQHGEPPDFIRIGGRHLLYPRAGLCRMLAKGYRAAA